MSNDTPYRLPAHLRQREFVASAARYCGYVGGRGSGKSFAGALKLLKHVRPGRLYMAAAPTYPMMRDATLRAFLALALQTGRMVEFQRGEMVARLAGGAEVLFRSAEDPDRTMRGPNLSGVWLDEASQMERAAFDLSIAALRECGEQGWLAATFTPKGKAHWTFDVFGSGRPDTALFHSTTADNPFNPDGFADGLKRQYTSAFAEQEIEGRFIDAGGLLAKREWFSIAEARPTGTATRWVRAWDFAATEASVRSSDDPDWTVGVLMACVAGQYVIAHVLRARVAGGGVAALVKSTAAQDGHGVEIALEQEPGASGKIASAHLIRELAGYNVRSSPATGDKVTRAMPLLAQAEAHNVSLVRGEWTMAFLDELCNFPAGSHDDQVDASALAFNTLARSGGMLWGVVDR